MSIATATTLKLLDEFRMNRELLNTPHFYNALKLVESVVHNPHLSAKFQTCIASMRKESLYDISESHCHIPRTTLALGLRLMEHQHPA